MLSSKIFTASKGQKRFRNVAFRYTKPLQYYLSIMQHTKRQHLTTQFYRNTLIKKTGNNLQQKEKIHNFGQRKESQAFTFNTKSMTYRTM